MPFGAFGEHQLGAVGDQQLAPLEAHRLGHRQVMRNAARGGDEGQRDAGVAAGRLDRSPCPGPSRPRLLGVPDHRRADAAFDRIGGIAALDLGQHGGVGAVDDAVEADERRVSDRERVVLEPVGHCSSNPLS